LNQDAPFFITPPRQIKNRVKEGGGAKKERILITTSARERILTEKLNLFCRCQGVGEYL